MLLRFAPSIWEGFASASEVATSSCNHLGAADPPRAALVLPAASALRLVPLTTGAHLSLLGSASGAKFSKR